MRIVTAAQMRAIEARAFADGVDPLALMRRAGQAVARVALERGRCARPLILIGAGNNGGDGLVVAEACLDAQRGPVTVWLYRREGLKGAPVRPDLFDHLRVIRGDADGTAAFHEALAEADLIVDAVYGIGGRDELPPDLVAVLRAVNARGREPGVALVALDVPTGVNADTGAVGEVAFAADLTVTLGRPKRGLFQSPGLRYSGRIAVAPIGLDDGDLPADTPRLITRDDALRLLPRRSADAHKGDAGALMIIGGSLNYFGAPVLAAHAALRAGVGLLTLAVPRSILGPVATQVAESTYLPLPESDWGTIGRDAAKTVAEGLERYTALQIGNGIGRDPATAEFLARLLRMADAAVTKGALGFRPAAPTAPAGTAAAVRVPILFDADGLNWLSTVEHWWEPLRDLPLVLTPHHGEFARLRQIEREVVSAMPWELAREAAREWGQTILLKGGYSVVATPDGALWVAPLANPALASAGTGDTLAGLVGGFLAQGLSPADAAILGLWVGARAGDLGSAAVGTLSLLAGDLPRYIAQAIRELEEGLE